MEDNGPDVDDPSRPDAADPRTAEPPAPAGPEPVSEPGPYEAETHHPANDDGPPDELDPDELDPDDTGDVPLPDALPPVVAVVVTHNPGPWFTETLESLRDQTYRALRVLVIDAHSDENPTPRIAEVLPGAFVRRIDHNEGFATAANEVLGKVEGASFFLLCHDDVALEPDAVRSLVEEAFRSNAGVAGPKLVDWTDPRRVRQVGASVDKTGVLAPFAEPGELDQEQHDAVRDVFVVPGACTLVRADLFTALGGYDTGIDHLGEDLDLCWRAHVAGARVLVVPAAVVRHREALGIRRTVDDRRRLQARHRLRSMLSNYGLFHLLRVLPQAVVFTVAEAIYALAAGQPRQAADVVAAWPWNLRRAGEILRKRRAVKRIRIVPDHEVRELQVRGSARLTAFVRGQLGEGDDRLSTMTRSGRQFAGTLRARSSRASVVLGLVVIAVVLLGTRNLLFRPIPAVGELATFPGSPGPLLRAWLSSHRPGALGSDGAAPTGLGLVGLGGYVFLGAMGLLRKVLILGMLPLGLAGAWRLARPIGSLRAGIAAFVVYAAIPVPYNALATGSWGGLVLYGVAPWLLLQVARSARIAPFGRDDQPLDSPVAAATPASRTMARQALSLGVLLALAGAMVPFVVVVAMVVAVAFVLGSLLAGRTRGLGRMVITVLLGVAGAAVLHLPWTVGLVAPGAGWGSLAGIGSGQGGVLSVGELLRFQSGPFGAAPLGWVFLVAAALPLIIGRGWRYEWAIRGWSVALVMWGLCWAGQEGWLPVALPPTEVLLAPAAAGLALAAAMGMASFEVDLPGYRFGWRQAVSTVAGLAVVVGVLPLLGGVIDGRWKLPTGDLRPAVSTVLSRAGDDPGRVLWVGDPEVVPVGGQPIDDRLVYATSPSFPGLEQRWPARADDGEQLLEAIETASSRRTNRLGALLAPMGVQYVIVPQRNVPAAYGGITRPSPRSFLVMLSEQLDLAEVESDQAVRVFRNTAYKGMAVLLPEGTSTGDGIEAALAPDAPAGAAVLADRNGRTDRSGRIDSAGDVAQATASSPSWRLTVDGEPQARRQAYGWANRFEIDQPGDAVLTHRTPPLHLVLCGVQVVLWAVALVLLRRTSPARALRRSRRRSEPLPDDADLVDIGVMEVPA